jgi:predicted regulator of Ras-like GTPase activity (Roadblock/LC7/MglB family)
MKGKNDWDFPEVEGDFSLIEDLDIIDTTEFEIVDFDEGNTEEVGNQSAEFESILESEPEINDGEVIEPSTIIEERIASEGAIVEDDVVIEQEEPLNQVAEAIEDKEDVEDKQPVLEAVEDETEKQLEEVSYNIEEPVIEVYKEDDESSYETKAGEEKKMVTKFKQEDLERMLQSFLEISPDFEAAAVVSADGFIIASALPEGADENKLGAMSAAILSLGERAASELEKGKLETVFVEGERGYILLSSLTEETLLCVSTTKYAKLGLVFYELSSLKKSLAAMFE